MRIKNNDFSSRRKHTSPDSPQALSSTGKRRRRLGGPRPQALSWVRQIVACDNHSLDRQIVAWAVVHGHRQKNHKCDVLSYSKNYIFLIYSNYVKFNKWRKYDSRPRKSERDQRRDLETCSRSKSNEKKDSSNFWSMASFVCIRLQSKWNDQEGGQRWQRWTIGPLPLTKLFLVSKSSPRKNLSQDGNHQHLAFGPCSWTTEQLQKNESLVNLFTIKLKFLPGNFSKNTTKKNRINSFPPDPGHLWPGFFCAWKKALVPIAHKHYHSHK